MAVVAPAISDASRQPVVSFSIDASLSDLEIPAPAGSTKRYATDSTRARADVRIVDGRDPSRLCRTLRADAYCTVLVAGPGSESACMNALAQEQADRVMSNHSPAEAWRRELSGVAQAIATLRELSTGQRPYGPVHVLLTGSTGFFGRAFLKLLLLQTAARVSVIARDVPGTPAVQRLPVLQHSFPGRIRILAGDVRRPGLGLVASDLDTLSDVEELWHLAASTNFENALREKTFSTNVAGTRNALELSRTLPALRCFNHISTAYVAGDQNEMASIPESAGDHPRRFRNPYEESKFEAETLVAQSDLPHRIFRPSILIGDSISGRSDGQTIYNIAKLVRMARRLADRDCKRRSLPADYHSFRIVADTGAAKNLIPADHAAALMLRAASEKPANGSIFHVTHDQPVRISAIVDVIARLLRAGNYEIVHSLEGQTLSLPERAMEKVAQVFRPYMTQSDPVFDTSALRSLVGDGNLPAIDEEYLKWTISVFYNRNQERRSE